MAGNQDAGSVFRISTPCLCLLVDHTLEICQQEIHKILFRCFRNFNPFHKNNESRKTNMSKLSIHVINLINKYSWVDFRLTLKSNWVWRSTWIQSLILNWCKINKLFQNLLDSILWTIIFVFKIMNYCETFSLNCVGFSGSLLVEKLFLALSPISFETVNLFCINLKSDFVSKLTAKLSLI